MKKTLFVLLTFMTLAIAVSAQSDYKRAIGLRFGGTYFDIASLSYKTFITDPGALEFNLGIRPFGSTWLALSVAVAYQHHFPIGNVAGLQWFVGGGATAYNVFTDFDYGGFGIGIFPTGGVDYKFSNIPLNVSADVRPTFYISRNAYWNSFYFGGALAARYTF